MQTARYCYLLLGVALLFALADSPPPPSLTCTFASLGAVAAGDSLDSLTISPDARHVAYVIAGKGEKHVVLDGVAGPAFQDIPVGRLTEAGRPTSLRFSADGKRLEYVAATEKGVVLVVDGKPTGPYEGINIGAFIFSPDSRRVAFIASRGRKEFVVSDGIEGKLYDYIAESVPRFSDDSKHIFYEARQGDHSVIVMDDKEIADEDFASNITFSRDGKRLAFVTKKNDRWQVVIDGVMGKPYQSIGNDVLFSSDSRHVLYSSRRDNDDFLVIDGIESDEKGVIREASYGFDSQGVPFCIVLRDHSWFAEHGAAEFGPYEDIYGSLIFSPDGKHMAFVAAQGKQRRYVIDGKDGPFFDDLPADLEFSPDGRHYFYPAIRDKQEFLIVDGQSTSCDALQHVLFSPDGRHTLISLEQAGKPVLALDGQNLPGFDITYDFAFSPDSSQLAYVGHMNGPVVNNEEQGGKDVLVVNGHASEPADAISTPSFTFDGGHLISAVRRGAQWHIRIDNSESPPVDEILCVPPCLPDGPMKFHALARRGGEYVRIDMTITGK